MERYTLNITDRYYPERVDSSLIVDTTLTEYELQEFVNTVIKENIDTYDTDTILDALKEHGEIRQVDLDTGEVIEIFY